MKVREILSFSRSKGIAFFLALVFVSASSFLFVNTVRAAGEVVLTGSAFSDPDAEDTHKASQWVITDASGGGNTVYDSGTDLVNLLSISVAGAFFTPGATYYWKVRYQDNHDIWSDYSDEASFTYGSGATPTPTSTPTNTSTATSTSTATITPTPSATTTAYCMFGWQTLNGQPFCGDALVADIALEDVRPDCDGRINLKYYVYDAYTTSVNGKTLSKASALDVHDFYYSLDGGATYKRFVHDYDFTQSYSWGMKPGTAGYLGQKYLIVEASVQLPAETVSSAKFRALVHVYPKSTVGVGLNWGNSFIPATGFDGIAMEDFDAAAFTSEYNLTTCSPQTPVPTTTANSLPCLYDFVSPKGGDRWVGGSSQQILWVAKSSGQEGDVTGQVKNKINLYLSTKTGQQKTSVAMMEEDNGVFSYSVDADTASGSKIFTLDTFNSDGIRISSCASSAFILGSGGGQDPITTTNIVLVLGSIFALAASYLAALVSSIPSLSRAMSSIFATLFAPPIWPVKKRKWGVVYDGVTKKPIAGAIVRIFSEPDGKQRDARRTNELGEFGFIVPMGSYSVTASKSGFAFPSHLVIGSSDGQYHNIYKGGEIDVHPTEGGKAPLNINIPIDQTKVNTLDIAVVATLHFVSRVASVIRIPLLIIGTIFSVYLAITQGRWYDYLILAFYVGLWAFEILDMIKKRAYGVAVDDSGKPVALAVVRVVDRMNRLKGTTVTGDDGKFVIALSQGEYRFEASKAGYAPIKSEFISINKISDIGKVHLRLNKLVNQAHYPEQDHSKL